MIPQLLRRSTMFIALAIIIPRSSGAKQLEITSGYKHIAPPEQRTSHHKRWLFMQSGLEIRDSFFLYGVFFRILPALYSSEPGQ